MTSSNKTSALRFKLPFPDQPYSDWSRLIKAVWMHGMSSENIDPVLVSDHAENARKSIVSSMTQRNEARKIRPSAFLACARQTYFAAQGEDSGKMPDNIGPTFAVGHLLHELSYAAVHSAMPKGFKVETEKEVDMPSWWPDDYSRFNQHGHVDMVVSVEDADTCSKYLSPDAPKTMLVDFKTMGGFSFKKHGKTIWGEDPDAFGYLAQLAIYSDALGLLETGAIVGGINRDSLTKPLHPRFITPKELQDELARLKVAVEMAVEGSDPGEEFLVRHGKEAHFQCGRSGRPGYCPFKVKCAATPTREEGDS
jgi:hypothetical protein